MLCCNLLQGPTIFIWFLPHIRAQIFNLFIFNVMQHLIVPLIFSTQLDDAIINGWINWKSCDFRHCLGPRENGSQLKRFLNVGFHVLGVGSAQTLAEFWTFPIWGITSQSSTPIVQSLGAFYSRKFLSFTFVGSAAEPMLKLEVTLSWSHSIRFYLKVKFLISWKILLEFSICHQRAVHKKKIS